MSRKVMLHKTLGETPSELQRVAIVSIRIKLTFGVLKTL